MAVDGICAVMMTDGRLDYLERSLASFDDMVIGPITRRVIHDDSGQRSVHERIQQMAPDWELVTSRGRSGFGGAYRRMWAWLEEHTDEAHMFGVEDDFTYNRPVDLVAMRAVLHFRSNLAQMALRRQSWSGPEIQAGGVVELNPAAYLDCYTDHGAITANGEVVGRLRDDWLEHRLFWTTNPSLYPRRLLAMVWPDDPRSESKFAARVFEDVNAAAGYWGRRHETPWVHHIGDNHHPKAKGY